MKTTMLRYAVVALGVVALAWAAHKFTAIRDGSAEDSDGDGAPDSVDPGGVPAGCGDGKVEPPEECDDGNRLGWDACKNDCSLNVCGDGVLRLGVEECDEADKNSNAPNALCRVDCRKRRCGDGILDDVFGEECDDPNALSGKGCDDKCKVAREGTCGDGLVQPPEECDEGSKSSNAPNASCRPDCRSRRCGDGIVDSLFDEPCDDGNAISGDGCDPACKPEGERKCGNGSVEKPEECDRGTRNSNAPNSLCRTQCRARRCGDGIVDDAFDEQCDDGNTVPGDGCDSRCRNEGSERGAFGKTGRTVFE